MIGHGVCGATRQGRGDNAETGSVGCPRAAGRMSQSGVIWTCRQIVVVGAQTVTGQHTRNAKVPNPCSNCGVRSVGELSTRSSAGATDPPRSTHNNFFIASSSTRRRIRHCTRTVVHDAPYSTCCDGDGFYWQVLAGRTGGALASIVTCSETPSTLR